MTKSNVTGFAVEINSNVDCNSENVIYLISCRKCPEQYVGETKRKFKDRMGEHRNYVRNQVLTKATGLHFNKPGHQLSDMQVTVLEKIQNEDPHFRKEREKMFISKFNTKYKGMNGNNGG